MKHRLSISKENKEKMLLEMIEIHKRARRISPEFVESVSGLSPLERAEAWLTHIANSGDSFSEKEALVYLVSRGHDCSHHIKKTITDWKLLERGITEFHRRARYIENLDSGETILWRKELSYSEASDILGGSVPDFWGGTDEYCQSLSIDATILRTVEWCDIRGFDEWWLRLAKMNYEMVIRGGLGPIPASLWLFDMCRSDYAIDLMRKALVRTMDVIVLPEHGENYPWRRWKRDDIPPQAVDHLVYAASIVFAEERVHAFQNDVPFADQAVEILQRHQDANGGWRCWADSAAPDALRIYPKIRVTTQATPPKE